MKFEEAREQVISAVHLASGALNEEDVWNKLARRDDVEFTEIELDSLAAMEMCLNIEENTGIEIDLGDLAQHPSVNSLAKYLVDKCATQNR
jgi:acyl carrier protein